MRNKRSKMVSIVIALVLLMSSIWSGTAFAYDKSYTASMVGNSHIDAAWLWDEPETVQTIKSTFSNAIDLMNKNPDYKFTQSSAQYYKWVQEYYPDLFKEIQDAVKKGQWEITGGQVIEPDNNITSGESLIRQVLYGKDYFRKEFNKDVNIGWIPDSFGFQDQIPQIFKKSGIDYFVTTKLNWNDTNKFPYEYFKWQGLDGSQLVTYKPTYDYPHTFNTANDINKTLDYPNSIGINESMALYGSGDHGGGPTQQNLDTLKKFDSDPNMPNVKLKTASQFFQDTKKDVEKLPVWNDELYLEYHRGTYTSQAAMKNYNRKSEITAEEAEKFSSMADWLGSSKYPYDSITTAWSKINLNQFHDILPGSAIHAVYQRAWNDSEVALNLLNSDLANSLNSIANRANTMRFGKPIVVFNNLSFKSTNLVDTYVNIPKGYKNIKIYDNEGREIPSQINKISDQRYEVLFAASNVPSIGYKTYYAIPTNSPTKYNTGLYANGNVLENKYYRLEIDEKTGNIKSLYDKINKKEVFNGEGNELQILEDTPTAFDAWNVDKDDMEATPTVINNPTSIKLIENGPVKSVIRVTKKYSNSTFIQDITLYSNISRIDVKMNVDWNESHKMLKVAFPLTVNPPKATYEIGYGAIERPTTRNNSIDGAKFEVPGQKWADMSNDGYGVSILNDSKYGWDSLNNVIRLSLLRSPKDPDPNADMGHHEFTYSIYPHSGDWKTANTVQKGDELNYPLIPIQTTNHFGDLNNEFSLMSVNKPNVVLSVVKRAENSDDMIVRVYESQGIKTSNVKIEFPSNIISAKETNLIEDNIGNANYHRNTLNFNIGKYEIKTFRVKLSKRYYRNSVVKSYPVNLGSYFNIDGISTDNNRKDGNFDGNGQTYSAELMPKDIVSQDVKFTMGPTTDGQNNFIQANGQNIRLHPGKYDYLYILGSSSGKGKPDGIFKVNYLGSSSTERYIPFTNWTATIGGFNIPKVGDTIGYEFTHNHNQDGDNLVKNNYLFMYKIKLDNRKIVNSLTLPSSEAIKVAAVTLVKGDNTPLLDAEPPTKVNNLNVKTAGMTSDTVELSWDASSDNIGIDHYNVYRSTKPDFSDSQLIGETSDTHYIDKLSTNGTYYYKVNAQDYDGNIGPESNSIGVVAGPMNLALGKKVKSDTYVSNEPDYKAVDGTVENDSKWCATGPEPHWLIVDLGKPTDITKFVIKHAGAGGESAQWNTRDFKIQISNDDNAWSQNNFNGWKDVVSVNGNTDNVTEHSVNNVNARYVRLFIERAGTANDYQGHVARIYEFEAYNDANIPPSAPDAPHITKVVPDNGKITLYFDKPQFSSDYIIKYGTESGKYTNIIKDINDSPYTITGLQNNVPYYFVMTAANPYGESKNSNEISIEPKVISYVPTDLSKYYNTDAMSYDTKPLDGDFDNQGASYVADKIPDSITYDGTIFNLGPKDDGLKNAVATNGQTISLPNVNATNLKILASASNGNQKATIVVNYTDGTSTTQDLNVSDWCNPQANENIVLKQDYRHTPDGNQLINTYIYMYKIDLDYTKNIKEIVLPNNGNLKVFALSLGKI